MRGKVLVGLMAALFVVTTAGPAFAGDGGLKHINFPRHDCSGAVPTHVDLYMHTWFYPLGQSGRMDGRIRYFSGQCVKSAETIHIFQIILWQKIGSRWYNVASSGSHDINVTSGDETWSTPDVSCNPPEPVSHVEVQYKIYWKDGTTSATRDDNSYDWNPSTSTECVNPATPIRHPGSRVRGRSGRS
jgi:hypothetical protein